MKYCPNCLQPDTRPNTKFSSSGICPACVYYLSLDDIDLPDRANELEAIVQFGRANSSSGYDCIIGGSGGKDSTLQSLFVKEVLGMNPLLVSLSRPPQEVNARGVYNISNLRELGFDCVIINPGPGTWRDLMRLGF